MSSKKLRIGLALGGGGARGMAHLGVLKILQKSEIEIEVFSGTSMGAMIAASYLQEQKINRSVGALKEFVLHFSNQFHKMDAMDSAGIHHGSTLGSIITGVQRGIQLSTMARKLSLENDSLLKEMTEHFLPPCNIEDLEKALYICTLDIKSGQGIFLNRGDVRKAVQSAMTIPGYFPPVHSNGRDLYDAQSVFPVPIHAFLHQPVDFILAVNVGQSIQQNFNPNNGIDLLFRQYDLLYSHVASELRYCADFVIHPNLEGIHWTDFHKIDTILKRGMEAADKAIPKLKALLKKHPKEPVETRPWHTAGYCDTPRTTLESI